MMPLLEGETVTYHGTYYDVDDVFIEPRTTQRPLLWIGGGSQLADPEVAGRAAVRRLGQGADRRGRRLDPPPDLPAAGHRPRLGGAPGGDARGRPRPGGLPGRARELPAPRHDERPGEGARGAAPGVPQGDVDERGPDYLESVYLFGTPDEIIASLQARVDAGVEYFFLHTMTPDPAQLQLWVDEIIPNVDVPADRRAGPPPAGPAGAMTRRVTLLGKPLRRRHSQVMHDAAFAAAGIDARYELLELEPDEVAGRGRGARATDEWLGLGVTAPYKRVVAGPVRRDRVRGGPDRRRQQRDRRSRRAARRVQQRRARVPGRRRARDGADARAAPRSSSPGRVARRTPSCSPASRRAPRRVTIGNRNAAAADTLATRFGGIGLGSTRGVVLGGAGVLDALVEADLAVNATTVGMVDPGTTITVGCLPRRGDRVRPRLRPGRDAASRGGSGARPQRGERVRDAHRAGRDRVRALDRDRRHGGRDARGGRAAARRPDGGGLTVRLATLVEATDVRRRARRGERALPIDAGGRRARPACATRAGGRALERCARGRARQPPGTGCRSPRASSARRSLTPARSTRSGSTTVPPASLRERPGSAARLRQGRDVGRGRRRDTRLGAVADGQRRRGVRARDRDRGDGVERRRPPMPCATSSAGR